MRLARATALCVTVLMSIIGASGCSGSDGHTAETTTTTAPVETTTTTEPPLEAGTQLYVYNPSVGDCFDRRQLDRQSTANQKQTEIVLKLDCSLPHQNEIFAVVAYPNDTGEFPGEDPIQTFAKQQCPASFEAYVGKAYEISELEMGYQIPTATAWGRGPQRIGCYLYDASGDKLVGSMSGSVR